MSKRKKMNTEITEEVNEKFNPNNYKKNIDVSLIYGLSTADNPEQAHLAALIRNGSKKIIYSNSNAGTGKTIVTLATSLFLINSRKKYNRIIYIREPIEVGKSLGFLPGDLKEKYDVYLDAVKDNLDELEYLDRVYGYNAFNSEVNMKKIEAVPPQFIRGRSITDAIIIVDEAQNMSMTTIKTILTRMGRNSKVILLGSTNQIDAKNMTKNDNDFMKSYDRIKHFDFVARQDLIKSERSGICSMLDEALSDYPINKPIENENEKEEKDLE